MFMAYEVTKQLISSLRAPVLAIQKNDRELADQLYRAANSVLLNLGRGRSPRMEIGASTMRSRKAAR
jgi:hypothetical protein